ncbi:MAG: DsbA family protein [Gammaproteobacteria bacterium]|nr:DsbA family protein [Gammaproteobacteria bacterium]
MMKCDPVTGACLIPELDKPVDTAAPAAHHGWAVHYIGDPMCSWCWGISPTVGAVENFCEAQGIEFSITMGGLRAGGGDPWNEAFKDFLRNEWQHIAQATGQPFGFSLLEAADFDYDTEPACRAVATVKLLQARNHLPNTIVLKFFSAVQFKFYAEGQDPKVADFYTSICASLALDFDEFRNAFNSPEAQQAVQQEFVRCRQWGVRSFPTLLLEHDGKTAPLAEGFVTTEQVLSRLRKEIAA